MVVLPGRGTFDPTPTPDIAKHPTDVRPFLFLLWLCSCGPALLPAQNIKTKTFEYHYLSTPSSPLPADHNTYSIDLSAVAPQLLDLGVEKSVIHKALKLHNFKRVDRLGHLTFTINAGAFSWESSKATKHEKTTKDKEGNESTTVYWTYDASWRHPMKVTFATFERELGERIGSTSTRQLGTSPPRTTGRSRATQLRRATVAGQPPASAPRTFKSEEAATKWWTDNKKSLQRKLSKQALLNTLAAAGQEARTKYDTYPTKLKADLEYLSGKKAPDATAWEQHATETATALAALAARQPITEELRQQFAPARAFWRNAEENNSPDDKKQRRAHHAALYNQARLAMLLEDQTELDRTLPLLRDHRVRKASNQVLSKQARTHQKRVRASAGGTLHFTTRDLSDVTQRELSAGEREPAAADPAEKAAESAEKVPLTYAELPAYFTKDGQRTEGTMVVPSQGQSWLAGKQTLVFRPADGGDERRFTPADFDELTFGDNKIVVRSRPAGTYGTKRRPSFFRVVEDGGAVRLLELIKHYADQDPHHTQFLEVPAEDKLVSLDLTNPRWLNWRRAFAQFFHDCPVLEAEIRVGYYKKNMTDIAKAIRSYRTQACK